MLADVLIIDNLHDVGCVLSDCWNNLLGDGWQVAGNLSDLLSSVVLLHTDFGSSWRDLSEAPQNSRAYLLNFVDFGLAHLLIIILDVVLHVVLNELNNLWGLSFDELDVVSGLVLPHVSGRG